MSGGVCGRRAGQLNMEHGIAPEGETAWPVNDDGLCKGGGGPPSMEGPVIDMGCPSAPEDPPHRDARARAALKLQRRAP